MKINSKQTEKRIIKFIKDYFCRVKKEKAIIGISGGLDSAIVAFLCAKALGSKNIIAAKLPYQAISGSKSLKQADQIIQALEIPQKNVYQINIKPVVDCFKKQKLDQIGLGNTMARIRMIYLYNLARKHNGLVVGTGNKSEILMGYFTRWGDGGHDINPIGSLYKTQIYQLARYLKIPKSIIKQPPSAGLWLGQTDEKELGISYQQLDKLLYLTIDKKVKKFLLIKKFGYSAQDVEKVLNRVKKNRFKIKLPPICALLA